MVAAPAVEDAGGDNNPLIIVRCKCLSAEDKDAEEKGRSRKSRTAAVVALERVRPCAAIVC